MKAKIISIITLSLILFTSSCTKDTSLDDTNVEGCTYPTACNYNSTATIDNGSCIYPEEYYDCDNDCINDVDNDGICDEFDYGGCNDSNACNYNPEADDNDGSCIYPEPGYNCDGSINTFFNVSQLFNYGVSFNEIVDAGYLPESITVTSITLDGCDDFLDDFWNCKDPFLEVFGVNGLMMQTGVAVDVCYGPILYSNSGFPFNISSSLFSTISVDVEDDDVLGSTFIEGVTFNPWNTILSTAQYTGVGNYNSSPSSFTVIYNDGTSCPTLTFTFSINW